MDVQLKGFPLVIYNLFARLACTHIGQLLIQVVDRFLWIIEGLNLFAVPEANQGDAKQNINDLFNYLRPLPWWIFIPALIYFRILRSVLTLFTWFLGMDPVRPMTVVYFIQTRRRKLRAIKLQGLKAMNKKPGEEETSQWTRFSFVNNFLKVIADKVQSVLCLASKIDHGNDDLAFRLVVNEPQRDYFTQRRLRKIVGTPESVEDYSTAELLEKYAAEDDNEDPDFDVKGLEVSETEDSQDSEPEENGILSEEENYLKLPIASKNKLSPKSAEENGKYAKYPESEQQKEPQKHQNGSAEVGKSGPDDTEDQQQQQQNNNCKDLPPDDSQKQSTQTADSHGDKAPPEGAQNDGGGCV